MKHIVLPILFFSLFTACTKDPGTSGCGPVKDIYYHFNKDTFYTNLVDIYKQGDTLKLKHNNGIVYYFIAQKPDSAFGIYKPVTGGSCDGDNYYLQYYQIVLKPALNTLANLKIKIYFTWEEFTRLRMEYDNAYYECSISDFPSPPSSFYYKDYLVNNKMYNNVGKITYSYTFPPTAYILFSREKGLIKITQPNGEYFELEP